MNERRGSFLAERWATWVPIGLALLPALRSATTGLMTDDYAFRAMLHAHRTGAPRAWDLFRFARGDATANALAVHAGHLPWWSAPDLKIHFLRPLTSLLFAFDDAVFGDHALGYHLHSLAWFLAFLVLSRALLLRLLAPNVVPLALLCIGLSHVNSSGVAWPSARHVLVGATLGVGAVLLQVVAREREKWKMQAAALGLFALALAASELALGALVLAMAIEISHRRLRWPLAIATLGTTYLIAYLALGGGARGGGGYHDPLREPGAFFAITTTRIPELLGDAVAAIPVELATVAKPLTCIALGVTATVGLAAGLGALRARLEERDRQALRIAALSVFPMLLLGATGFPSARVLTLANLPVSMAVGIVLHGAARAGAPPLTRGIGVVLALTHFVLAPWTFLRDVDRMVTRARRAEDAAEAIRAQTVGMKRVVLVAASDPYLFLYPRGILAQREPEHPRCWSVLSPALHEQAITRTGEATLRITALGGVLVGEGLSALFRAPELPFAPGDTFDSCGLRIQVADVRAGRVTALDVTFERPLEVVARSLFVEERGVLRTFALPPLASEVRTRPETRLRPAADP